MRIVSRTPGRKQIELAVRGKRGPLLRILSEMPIDDLTFGPPDLEDVFLHNYSDTEKPAESPVEVQ